MSIIYTRNITTIVTMNCKVINVLSFLEGLTVINAKMNRKTVMNAQKMELYDVACYLVDIPYKTA